MSASSATTLISPTTTVASARSTQISGHQPQRRQSTHSAHAHTAHHGHHPKRRASQHHVHHTSGSHAGPSRRTSEGEQGRRALVAGLAMQMMDSGGHAMQKSRSRDRPLTKSSRSDTHLPTLTRTTSITSDASTHSTDPSAGRPKSNSRSKSGESVQVLSEDGKEAGEVVDAEDEGWESGEEEVKDTKPKAKAKSNRKGSSASISAMRRTVSDTQAEVPPKAEEAKAIVDPALALRRTQSRGSGQFDNIQLTQRTTGFAGTVTTPAADPSMEVQAMKNISTPHYNDPTHVMPAHQVRHQQSSRSIRAAPNPSDTDLKGLTGVDGEKTPKPSSVVRTSSGRGHSRQSSQTTGDRPVPEKTRSTDGSGLPPNPVRLSPSFPFPKMQSPESMTSPKINEGVSPTTQPSVPSHQQRTPPTAARSEKGDRMSDPPAVKSSDPRQRVASGNEPRLRHRYSNSSLRSIQSLRAPPHPLNSPVRGYKAGPPTVATSRPGSILDSPSKGERRGGQNLHHPPVAPPVVYKEIARGEGYSEDGNEGPSFQTGRPNGASDKDRTSSFSSQRSLQGLISVSGKARANTSSPLGIHAQPAAPSKRRTAIEAAAAAAKMPTTSDPVEYHHSMGYPASSAESAHLISRFLPQRKARNLDWEITSENSEEHSGIGLSRGEYRDAHESLVRMMRDMNISGATPARRPMSRTFSQQGMFLPGSTMGMSSAGEDAHQIGAVRGRNGTLAISRGGWKGKTPFEMSVDRCLALRPQRPAGAI